MLQRGRHDLITGGHRHGHLDIVFQAEQRDQRLPYLAGVLGDQHPDHRELLRAGAAQPGRRAGGAGTGKPSIRSSLCHFPAVP